jgi:hypothetical protein
MREASTPSSQGRTYGRQLREALDRIEGLIAEKRPASLRLQKKRGAQTCSLRAMN